MSLSPYKEFLYASIGKGRLEKKANGQTIFLLHALFIFLLFGYIYFFPRVLVNLSRIYQRAYRCWNFTYAGLGEEGIVYRLEQGRRLLCRKEFYSQEFAELFRALESRLPLEGRLLQIYEGTRETYLLPIAGVPYIVKKCCKLPFLENLFYSCRYSRSAWNNGERARKGGFATCYPVALIEFGTPLRLRSYLLYPLLGKVLAEKREERAEWLPPLLQMVAHQKKLGILHADFHCKNVVQLDDGSIQYIDIDDLHWYCPFSYIYHLRFQKELHRFNTDFPAEEISF